MYCYSIFGKLVSSDLKLRIAYEIDSCLNPEVFIRENKELPFFSQLDNGTKENQDGMIAWKKQADNDVYYYIKEYGVFKISKGSMIEYNLLDDFESIDFVELFILNTCFPHIITQCGQFAMHGSAVKCEDKCIIVSGESGSGKSTLSEVILKKYGKYLSDDVVLIKEDDNAILAMPSFPCRKLCSDAAEKFGYDTGKIIPIKENDRDKVALIDDDEYYPNSLPLDAIVVIRPDDVDKVTIKKIEGAGCLKYIINNLYEIESYGNKKIPPTAMMLIMKMAQKINVYELVRPNGKMTVEEQVELLERELLL